MRKIKLLFVMCISIMLIISLPVFGDYFTHGMTLIGQAAAKGPPAGWNLLIGTNWKYGARGCAVRESYENPARAANLLIAIAQRLIIFANTTTETRVHEDSQDPIRPRRNRYWMDAIHQLDLADKYIRKLVKTNPQLCANMAIRIATIYYNSIPTNPNYIQMQRNYVAKARYHLYDNNIHSAHGYIKDIKNKDQRAAMLKRIKALHQNWKTRNSSF